MLLAAPTPIACSWIVDTSDLTGGMPGGGEAGADTPGEAVAIPVDAGTDRGIEDARPACDSGCVTFASGEDQPGAVAVSASFVYWVDDVAAGSVKRCPRSGCIGPPTIVAASESHPHFVSASGGRVAWGDLGSGNVSLADESDLDAGSVLVASAVPSLSGVAVHSAGLFWLSSSAGIIYRCALPGCTAGGGAGLTTTYQPFALVPAASHVVWAENDPPGSAFHSIVGVLAASPVAQNGAPDFALYETAPVAVAGDGATLVWTTAMGALRSAPQAHGVDGGVSAPATTVVTGLTMPVRGALAIDASYAYVGVAGGIVRVARAGGAIEPIVQGIDQLGGLAVDTTQIYWTDTARGVVMQQPK